MDEEQKRQDELKALQEYEHCKECNFPLTDYGAPKGLTCQLCEMKWQMEDWRRTAEEKWLMVKNLEAKAEQAEKALESFKATVYHDEVCCSTCAEQIKDLTARIQELEQRMIDQANMICSKSKVLAQTLREKDSMEAELQKHISAANECATTYRDRNEELHSQNARLKEALGNISTLTEDDGKTLTLEAALAKSCLQQLSNQ